MLFITYTNDLRSRFNNCVLIKYADDAVIVRLITISDEINFKGQIDEISQWYRSHNLLFSVVKTKEIIVDFRHCDIAP